MTFKNSDFQLIVTAWYVNECKQSIRRIYAKIINFMGITEKIL